ncbi:MAG: hypothetical protein RI897_4565 [Verrucomicrobiota bacterium]
MQRLAVVGFGRGLVSSEAFHLRAGKEKAIAKGCRWFRGRWMWPAVRGDRMGLREILRQLGVG